MAEENRSFEDMAFSTGMSGRTYLAREQRRAAGGRYRSKSKPVCDAGVNAALGRGLIAEPPGFGAVKNAGTIVLSDARVRSAFGGDKNIVGRVVRLNDKPLR